MTDATEPKLFILLFVITLTACSSSDSEDNTTTEQTFLEKYDNAIWLKEGESGYNQTVYFHFENNQTKPAITIYNLPPGECFQIEDFSSFAEILENNSNTLKIRYTFSVNEYQTDTFTIVNGNIIYSWFELYYDNVTTADYNLYETLLSIEDIDLCN